MFEINENTPIAALTIRQFRELIGEILKPDPPKEELPEIIGKKQCKELTGYAVNTINRLICDKKIPFYKMGEVGGNGRVYFKRDEVIAWMTKSKIKTTKITSRKAQIRNKSDYTGY